MDAAGWIMLVAVALVAYGAFTWWRRRVAAGTAKFTPSKKPRDKRRGPRRVNTSRRESFRMGKDDNDRRSGQDRRDRKPGWDDGAGKR